MGVYILKTSSMLDGGVNLPGTILSLDLGQEKVQGCSETLWGLLAQEHFLDFMRKKDWSLVSRAGWHSSQKDVRSGVLADLGLQEEIEALVAAPNTHSNPESGEHMGVPACLAPSSHPCRRACWRLKVKFPMDPISPRLQEPRGCQEFL